MIIIGILLVITISLLYSCKRGIRNETLEMSCILITGVSIIAIIVCIPWCVCAWSPSLNNIEKSKVDAQKEAIEMALSREDCDVYVLARDVGEFNGKVRSMKKLRENIMFKDYVWRFYDEIEEIDVEVLRGEKNEDETK